MSAVLLGCGLRRSELIRLNLPHLQQRDEHWPSSIYSARAALSAPFRFPLGEIGHRCPGRQRRYRGGTHFPLCHQNLSIQDRLSRTVDFLDQVEADQNRRLAVLVILYYRRRMYPMSAKSRRLKSSGAWDFPAIIPASPTGT